METLSSVYAPYIGANGNWYVNNEDTGVKAQGPAGPQGPEGHCGMQGETGEVGETGEKGDRGPKGPTGHCGIQGETGERGEKGEKGDRGPKGPAGHCGTQGLIGPKGEIGDRGPQGIQGSIGGTGIQGPKGDKGDKGDVGNKGDKGDTPALAADLQTTVAGKALDATMGKSLDDKVTELTRNLTDIKSYAFIKSSTYSKEASIKIKKKNGVIYFNITLDMPITPSWQDIEIGTVRDWDNGAIGCIGVVNSIGGDSDSALVKIDADGVVKCNIQSAITASKWFYGSFSILID